MPCWLKGVFSSFAVLLPSGFGYAALAELNEA